MSKKKILTYIGSPLLSLVILTATAFAINTISTGYQVATGDKVKVTSSDGCQSVTNNGSSDIFVPTATPPEWNAFLANKPSYVTTGACTAVPGVITVVNAAASVSGSPQATINFAPPDTGGSSITSYTVTSNPGNIVVNGSASPIIVTGLTKGTDYTFSITATNAVGTGPSATSNSVTPTGSYQAVEYQFIAATSYYPCTPFLEKKTSGWSSTYQAVGSNTGTINYTGSYTTKNDAISATVSSLESCLRANNYVLKSNVMSGDQLNASAYGLANIGMKKTGTYSYRTYANTKTSATYSTYNCSSYSVCSNGGNLNNFWYYKDLYQITYNSANGLYSGTARLVDYAVLTGLNPDGGNTGTRVYPESITMQTVTCTNASDQATCPSYDASVPTYREN